MDSHGNRGLNGRKEFGQMSFFIVTMTHPDGDAWEQVEAAVSRDPFALEGLIESLTIFERDPLFGTFAAESSGEIAALLAKAVP